ncbi:MAG: hypothetical protein WCN95_12015 [bacterium]
MKQSVAVPRRGANVLQVTVPASAGCVPFCGNSNFSPRGIEIGGYGFIQSGRQTTSTLFHLLTRDRLVHLNKPCFPGNLEYLTRH